MNLINEQSVTTSATSSTDEELRISLAQAKARRVRSSLDSDNSDFVTTIQSSLSTFARSSSEEAGTAAAAESSSVVESINRRQIKNISNTISSSDANQINLIRKMPTTTATTAGKASAAGSAASNTTVAPIIIKTTTTTTVNIDNANDVSDCIKNKNGDTISSTTGATTMLGKYERTVGCEHYKRRAMFVTPCCKKFYKCRYCHDENETHHFDRKTLTELICVECDTRQQVQEQCQHCGVRFGKYTCLICNLFDDEDKNQYHCDGCGICRIGGRDNFFHCEVCNMCLPIELQIEGHRCVENISRSNCPVCLGAIHTSRIPCHIPDCGHLLHKMCFDQLLASGHYVCPTCQTSLLDMSKMWEYLDAQASLMTVPKKYENQRVYIFCNDCHETCKTKFHFVGLKCVHCGGYNTTQDVKRRMSWVNGADSSTSA